MLNHAHTQQPDARFTGDGRRPPARLVMHVLIGDNALNQMFLAIVVKKIGFDEVETATTAEALLLAAGSGPDLIIFDPLIEHVGLSAPDIMAELTRLVPRSRLVVVSASASEVERARADGIRAARKQSLLRLEEIEDTITEAASQLADEVRDEHATKLDLVASERDRSPAPEPVSDREASGEADTYDWQAPLLRTSGAKAPVLVPPVRSTSGP
jgi:DNA-binding NarL/FixJ family response regulator